MFKVIVVSAALVLAIGSGAMGSIITQDQGFGIGTDNLLSLLQGQQSASSSQNVIVSVTQDVQGSGSLLGSASLISVNNGFGGLSVMSSLMLMGNALTMGSWMSPLLSANFGPLLIGGIGTPLSGTSSDWADEMRLHSLMNSGL